MPPLHLRAVAVASAQPRYEVRVCTNRTCKAQGSQQLVQLGRDLHLEPALEVKAGGCLGQCGSGPNLAILPTDGTQPLLIQHVGTVAKLAAVLRDVCGAPVDAVLLRATELRLAGNAAALELHPPLGVHLLLSNRSGARLAAGDFEGALADANAAVEAGPPDFSTAAVRQAEAHLSLHQPEAALRCLLEAVERSRDFKQSDAFRELSRRVRAMTQQTAQSAV
eukprot:scaffold14.g1240.t1